MKTTNNSSASLSLLRTYINSYIHRVILIFTTYCILGGQLHGRLKASVTDHNHVNIIMQSWMVHVIYTYAK